MANTKVTKAVLADDAVGLAQLDITNDPSDGQALTAVAVSDGYNLTWADNTVSSTPTFTSLTVDSDNTDTSIIIESDLDGSSLFTSGIDLRRETVAKGSRIESLRDASAGGVGLNFLTTADNAAEVSGTLTERMTITPAGRTGLHTTSPDAELHIEPVSSNASILLSNNGRTQYYRIQNNESADALTFNLSDASEKLRIQSGGGISFNGDTAAANALDDYEEGTWTPTVSSGTMTNNNATYTKVGNIVHIAMEITLGGTRAGSTFTISGLPFTPTFWTAAATYIQYYNDEGTEQITAAFRASNNDIRFINFGGEAHGTDFGNGYMNVAGSYRAS